MNSRVQLWIFVHLGESKSLSLDLELSMYQLRFRVSLERGQNRVLDCFYWLINGEHCVTGYHFEINFLFRRLCEPCLISTECMPHTCVITKPLSTTLSLWLYPKLHILPPSSYTPSQNNIVTQSTKYRPPCHRRTLYQG